MSAYTDVFGGANIYPSDVSYREVDLSSNTTLNWPNETSETISPAARIMDVVASLANLVLTLPDATQVSPGETLLINGTGAFAFDVKDAQGNELVNVSPGISWQLYLTDNTTVGGTWNSVQFGSQLSQANAAALAGTGLVAIGSQLFANDPILNFSTNYASGVADRSKLLNWTGSSGTLSLTAPTTLTNGWFIYVRNSGSGSLTVPAPGSTTIDGGSSKVYNPGDASIVATDGANFYTVGFGQSSTFAFDHTSINVAGTGNYTLSGTELNRVSYSFTGALTGNRVVIVPATVQQYWASNDTTGAYTLTIKTLAGTGYTLPAGQSAILYCDGTNVRPADTAGVSVPIAIADGGTGSTTASAARIALGGSSIGISIFTAADGASVYAVIGNPTSVSGGTF